MVLSGICKINTPGRVPEVAFRSAVCQCLCNVSPVLGVSYLCGAWSLDIAIHDGKSGLLQNERSSSRALIVSLSPCSRYSSSVRYLKTNFFDLK